MDELINGESGVRDDATECTGSQLLVVGGQRPWRKVGRRGGSCGYRTIVAYRRGDRAVFLFGFAKNERANLDDDEMAYWRQVGRSYLGLDDDGLEAAIAEDELMEVSYGDED